MRKHIWAILMTASFAVFSFVYFDSVSLTSSRLSDMYIRSAQAKSGVENIVTSIYLDFRVFDTLFEALLLLISVVAIFQFIKLEIFEDNLDKVASSRSINFKQSDIQRTIISIIYPLFIMFGIYVIARGADSPGGGFQGGAILATVVMCRYLIVPSERYDYKIPYFLEKIFYALLLLIVVVFISGRLNIISTRNYIIISNVIIGLKVAFGLSAIFLRFIYFGKENKDE